LFLNRLVPSAILSPSFLAHDRIVPVSIVGDNAGRVILLWVGKLPDDAYRIVIILLLDNDNNRPLIRDEGLESTRVRTEL
jgi:hypothetical protein